MIGFVQLSVRQGFRNRRFDLLCTDVGSVSVQNPGSSPVITGGYRYKTNLCYTLFFHWHKWNVIYNGCWTSVGRSPLFTVWLREYPKQLNMGDIKYVSQPLHSSHETVWCGFTASFIRALPFLKSIVLYPTWKSVQSLEHGILRFLRDYVVPGKDMRYLLSPSCRVVLRPTLNVKSRRSCYDLSLNKHRVIVAVIRCRGPHDHQISPRQIFSRGDNLVSCVSGLYNHFPRSEKYHSTDSRINRWRHATYTSLKWA